MFDASATGRAGGIPASDVFGHRLAAWLLAVDVRSVALGLQPCFGAGRAIPGIGPDRPRAVGSVQNRGQFMPIMARGICAGLTANKPPLTINADMVLVAEMWHRDINQTGILLTLFGCFALEYLTVQRA